VLAPNRPTAVVLIATQPQPWPASGRMLPELPARRPPRPKAPHAKPKGARGRHAGHVMKRVVDDLTRPVSCRPHSRRTPERIDGGKALNIPPEAPSCQKPEALSRGVRAACGPTRGVLYGRQPLSCSRSVVGTCYGASGFATKTGTRDHGRSGSRSVAPSRVEAALCLSVACGDRPSRRCGDGNRLSNR